MISEPQPAASAESAGPFKDFPPQLRAAVEPLVNGHPVLAAAQFDLDATNRYATAAAVLTQSELIVHRDGQATLRLPLGTIDEAIVLEGVGLDRVIVRSNGAVAADMGYTRTHRKAMVRLQRKLEHYRDESNQEAADKDPAWLDFARVEDDRPARKDESKKVLFRLLDIARPYRWRVNVALLLTLGFAMVLPLQQVFTKYLIDTALTNVDGMSVNERLRTMAFYIGLMVITLIVIQTMGFFRLRILTALGTRISHDLRHKVYAHMQHLSMRFFGKRRVGSLITRVTSDTDRLWDFVVFGSVDLVRDVAMILITACFMFWMNWKLAIIALLPMPLVGLLAYYSTQKMTREFSRLWTYWSRLSGVVGDALPGVKVIKAFSNEKRETDRFARRNDQFMHQENEALKAWTDVQPLIDGMMALSRLLVLAAGSYLIIQHGGPNNTVGTLIAFVGFVHMFHMPVMELARSNRIITRAATSAQRVFEVLDTPAEPYDVTGSFKKDHVEGKVEFRNVSFSYEGAQPALRGVSLSVEPGQMIGLCGHSGAGKSTFVNLITRFYDVTDGQILIDGVDVRDWDLASLRRHIGVVLQEPYLFAGTIADNIRYGRPEASDDEVIEAARAANAHDFVVGLPDGYDTIVGERGQSLSGGERQRISIARAILHNPKVLILDEATSSLDTETERQIQQALDRLVSGRTTFAIAHRLSTLTNADNLVVLDKGKIVETGSHAELVAKPDGTYAKLHKTQMDMANLVAA